MSLTPWSWFHYAHHSYCYWFLFSFLKNALSILPFIFKIQIQILLKGVLKYWTADHHLNKISTSGNIHHNNGLPPLSCRNLCHLDLVVLTITVSTCTRLFQRIPCYGTLTCGYCCYHHFTPAVVTVVLASILLNQNVALTFSVQILHCVHLFNTTSYIYFWIIVIHQMKLQFLLVT